MIVDRGAAQCTSIFFFLIPFVKKGQCLEKLVFIFSPLAKRMEFPWWRPRPKSSKFKTYGAKRGYIGWSTECEASVASGQGSKSEDVIESSEVDDKCARCPRVVCYADCNLCWDCGQRDRVIHPRRVYDVYPQYFKKFSCGKCVREFVGFVQCSPCEGCPYSDCLEGASERLRCIVERRTRRCAKVR